MPQKVSYNSNSVILYTNINPSDRLIQPYKAAYSYMFNKVLPCTNEYIYLAIMLHNYIVI